MNHLTNSRLVLHAIMMIVLVFYLFWAQVSFRQSFLAMFIFAVVDLIYLSSVIISNMKPQPPTMSLEKKKVIITGGSSGIGLSLAKLFVSAKCSCVVLIARNEDRLKKCVEELQNLGSKEQIITYASVDLSQGEKVASKIDDLLKEIGGVDILVNSAGYSVPGEFQNLKLQDFKDMVDTNYLGSVNITHAVVPHMIKQNFGHLVFLSSVGGQLGVAGFSAYAPSKYAIRGFAEVMQAEMRPYGIGVSLVFPPDTKTPGLDKENESKPAMTKIISEQAGVWESDTVAKVILNGLENRKFMIGFGSDGYFMNALTSGAAPSSSVIDFWLQSLLVPIVRVYMLFLQNHFTNVISNNYKLKTE